MSTSGLDAARQAALDNIRRSEKRARLSLTAAGVMEAALFVGILLVIDLSDRTHLLIFLCACLAYGPIAFGMFALRSHLDVSTQRLLKGIELGRDQ